MSEENQSGFKVTDRRMFNPDGSLRDDAVIEETPAPPPEPPPVSATAAAAAPARAPEQEIGDAPEQTEFTEFLMRMASEAFIYLGLVEHPMTGRRQVDLPAAKESIDMLAMLRAKTDGNLTPGEARFFQDLLSDLKMQYVSFRR
jgi:hypothetical protein